MMSGSCEMAQILLPDLPSGLLTDILNFTDGLTLLESRLINKRMFVLTSLEACRPVLQNQLASMLCGWVIELDVYSAVKSIRIRFCEELACILSDRLSNTITQVRQPDLSNLTVPELRYCIFYFDESYADFCVITSNVKATLYPDDMIWLSTNALPLEEIEEEMDSILPHASDIMNNYKKILSTHVGAHFESDDW